MTATIEKPTMTATRTDSNPYMENSDRMDHWRCTLRYKGRSMTVTFSKGEGHHGAEPTIDEVLECLVEDARSWERSTSFEEWAGEYGYNTDSRKAERTYRAVKREAEGLRRLLGTEYDAILDGEFSF